MNPGHANVGNAVNLVAIKLCRRACFFRNCEITGTGRYYRN